MLLLTLSLILSSIFVLNDCYIIEPGPKVKPTRGEVWPIPQEQTKSEEYFIIRPTSFKFQGDKIECQDFIQDAFRRYWTIISNSGSLAKRQRFAETGGQLQKKNRKLWLLEDNFQGYLQALNVELTTPCLGNDVRPDENMIESYELTLNADEQKLTSSSIWGILRGLETFSQLVYFHEDQLHINATHIKDFPRFPHRGLMIDTARHFQPLYILLQALDGMAYNKMNVFHWHLTDDQSFPYKSLVLPELSDQGAYHPVSRIYEPSDVRKVIDYARKRGIRVIPEFDTPGHTRSWGVSHPELLVPCYDNKSQPTGQLGPMDPTKDSTYAFLKTLFTEVLGIFPDAYFHMGGDEVEFECWKSNPDINAFMAANNISDYAELESYFIQKVVAIMNDLKASTLVWEEVYMNGVETPNSTIIHVWTDDGFNVMKNVTADGKFALFSSCWYLDHLATGGDWENFYKCDPYDFKPNEKQKQLIVGGEACMWGEVVNEYNILSRIWPRASSTAEKLWSDQAATGSWEDSAPRIEEHACRMNHRGLPAQPPNGAGVCL